MNWEDFCVGLLGRGVSTKICMEYLRRGGCLASYTDELEWLKRLESLRLELDFNRRLQLPLSGTASEVLLGEKELLDKLPDALRDELEVRSTGREEGKRLLCVENYDAWCRRYFPDLCSSKGSWFHQEGIEQVVNEKKLIQMRCWYRGAGKSTHARTLTAIFLYLLGLPRFRQFAFFGSSEEKAIEHLEEARHAFSTNEKLMSDYNGGKPFIEGRGRKEMFELVGGARFFCRPLGGGARGVQWRGNRLQYAVIDDIETDNSMLQETTMQQYFKTVTQNIYAAFGNKGDRCMIICNNKHRKGGLVERLQAHWQRSPEFKYSQVDLLKESPLRSDSGSWNGYSWRGAHPNGYAKTLYKSMGRIAFEREYQNIPLEETHIFDESQWKEFEFLENSFEGGTLVCYWDFSYSRRGDHKAGVYILLRYDDGSTPTYSASMEGCYILDVFCRRCTFEEAFSFHLDKYDYYTNLQQKNQDGEEEPKYDFHSYFDCSFQQNEVYTEKMNDYCEQTARSCILPSPHKPMSKKEMRIAANVGNLWRQGKVYFSSAIGSADLAAARSQLLGFNPTSNRDDDFPDALAGAIEQALLHRRTSFGHFGFLPVEQVYGTGSPLEYLDSY